MTAYSLFNKAFKDYSEHTALITSDNKKISYGQIKTKAGRIAALLKKKGIPDNAVIAILMDRNDNYLITVAACLLYGYGFVTMDTEYPENRRQNILADSNAAFVIDEAFFMKAMNEDTAEILCSTPSPDAPAYIIFTSGSTGKPKGIIHDQESLAAGAIRNAGAFSLTGDDVWGVTAPFTFVALVVEVLSTWVSGAAVKIVPRNTVKDPELLASYIAGNSITASNIPPRILPMFTSSAAGFRLAVTGGEKIGKIGKKSFRTVGAYGQSETCGPFAFCEINENYVIGAIGKAAEDTSVHLLDENLRESDSGEICVSGHFMSGYIGNVNNPYTASLLHTGDLGKRNADGDIIFVNRKDWMIKINGQRVEPGEIEETLKAIGGISDAAVKSFVNRYGQTYIAAYYVSSDNIGNDSVRKILQEKLPSYMVPSFLLRLSAMPLNANKKLDRNALPEPDASAFLTEYVKPETEAEAVICNAFASVLGVARIGITDDFFRLGGDSIKAAMAARECSAAGISVKHIFVGKTPREIAKLAASQSDRITVQNTDSDRMPLTDSQMGVFLDANTDSPDCRYNIPFVLSFPPETDAERLREALYRTWKNHQAFSIGIDLSGSVPTMFETDDGYPDVEIIETDKSEYEKIRKEFVRPFILGKDRLYRAEIIKTDEGVHLLSDIHHIIFDGSSLEVFQKDILDAYRDKQPGREVITPFMVSASENVRNNKDSTEYFRELLSNCDSDSNLNPDLSLPELGNSKGVYETFANMDSDFVEFFTKSAGITENTLFASAFALALAKFTCQDQSLFVSVENGRGNSDMEHTVGMFVRSFPVFIPINEEKKTIDYLTEVRDRFFDAMSHDNASFADIADTCQIDSSVKFVYQSELLNGLNFGDGKIKVETLNVADALSNLDMMVLKQNGSYKVSVGYRKALYSPSLIESFVRTFLLIADGLVRCVYLKDIALVDSKEKNLLDSFNMTDYPYGSENIVETLRRQVKKHPDKVAVCMEGKTFSYAEFDRITDSLASFIVLKGIKKDEFVAVLTTRSILIPVYIWGIIKAGCAYQPLDPAYPAERLNFMIKDSGTRLLISERNLRSILSEYSGDVLFSDEIGNLDCSADLTGRLSDTGRGALLYTSGTTGLPKGVILNRKNLASFANYTITVMGLGAETRYAAYASFGFDACAFDMLPTLMAGGTVYVVPEEIRLDLKALNKFYTSNRITHGFITTQLGCLFMQGADLPDLKCFGMGGEKIIPFKPSPEIKVLNMYGPTECSCFVTTYAVKNDSPIQPIGKPNYNVKLYITDRYSRRLPVGACGELLVAGPQVSEGYYNRPDRNAESFISNPFCDEPEYRRIYRTGDITRFLPDGNVEFVGRRDGQVKIRGFRVELKEVEQVILSFEGITNATVQAFDENGGGKYLAGYIAADKEIDIEKLRSFIADKKPSYMVPSVIMQLESIPLNQNGKVNRRQLPLPQKKAEETVKPQNELQKKILECVSDILGTDEVGITTDIFAAGLTSLGTIRLNALLSDTFNVVIRTGNLRENSTVEKLEKFISSASKEEESAVVYSDYPITKTQEGIFLESQNNPKGTSYNIPYLVKLDSSIDIRRLKSAICETVAAHNYVNTTMFLDKDGNIRQKLAPAGCFTVEDIETVKAKSIEEVKKNLIRPYELIGERLFRISIIEAEATYLFLDFHHIIFDGTSLAIFICDIEQSYSGKSPAEEKFTGYDVALSEQKLRNSPAYLDAEEYYTELLTGEDTDYLPRSDLHFTAEKGSGKYLFRGKAETTAAVSAFCKKNGVSENSVLCSSFGHLLSMYNGTGSALFTTVYNGRNDSRMGRTVSMLVKTIPVLFKPEKEDIFSVVSAMSKQLVDSMTNDICSFADIAAKFSVRNDVMFIFQGEGFINNTFCGKPCSVITPDFVQLKAPIAIQVTRTDGCYEYSIEYDNSLYSKDFAAYIIQTLDKVVSQLITVGRLSDISMLEDSAALALDRINSTETPYNRTERVTNLLKRYASQTPDTPAVTYLDKSYSFCDFDHITDSIASRLRSMGAQRNTYVAILVDRSENMAITAWGAVKSGAAYLPIDPSYPAERISLMLSDSNAKILITERDKIQLLPDYDGKILFTDEIAALPEADNFHADIAEEDPFVLIYSSGSTGIPKGSIIPHRSVSALTRVHAKTLNSKPGEKVAFYASFGFDAAIEDIFCDIANGLTLCIVPENIRLDIPLMEKFFVENAVNHGFMTTQVARPFLQNTKCSSLKTFFFGGEKMIPFTPPENIKVMNGYGPSETNCYVLTYTVKNNSDVQPIGRQSDNIKLYVTDKTGKRLPPYCCGELCIAGPQVALGYLNRSEKTAASFVSNPFCSDKDYSIMYRTGDIVRMFADGNYDFVGRRDGQVKIRGYRIELGEIEQVISQFPGVDRIAVRTFDEPDGGKFIAAYFVAEKTIEPEEIASFIKKSRPSYMVPAFIMQVDSIPLTANGKVNFAKLPEPHDFSSDSKAEPVGETEIRLCELFSSVLGGTKVYAEDNFFEIGGNSILALQLVVKCVNSGMMVVYKNLFENPTPRSLAKLIEGTEKEKDVFAPTSEQSDEYDYSALEYNIPENLGAIEDNGVGDVLLTGSTGFLGIHVLKYLLESSGGKIFCMVRKKGDISAADRLKLFAEYYFEDDLSEYKDSRIKIVESELTDPELFEKLGSCKFDTIINCAANVHHFGSEEALMSDNYKGIDTLIRLALSRGAKLVQTSTISVAGESVNNHIPQNTVFRENNLNIGQSLENLYVRTKYLAEQAVIDAVARKGLRGKIVRFGNLMARNADGEFQINSSNNGFLKLINSYRILGCYPVNMLDASIEFSPIDKAAKALIMLAGTPDKFTVFHANNAHSVHMANILEVMNLLGYRIDYVKPEDFSLRFAGASRDEELANELSGLLAYRNKADSDTAETRFMIANDNSYTVKALYRLGFSWPLTEYRYIESLLKNLDELNYFS